MRNIVNLLALDDLLRTFSVRYQQSNNLLVSQEQLSNYVHGNIKNYCLRKAPIKRDFFFYWRDKNFLEQEIFKKSDGPYHVIDLKEMFYRIQNVLDFICYSGYSHDKNITSLDFEEAEFKHELWIRQLRKKQNSIEGVIEEAKKFSNGFKIVLLVDKTAYEREGFVMNHCVGGYYNRSNSDIYSLRDNKGKSLVTIEVKDGIIIQYLMYANKLVTSDLKPYLNEFAKDRKYKFIYMPELGRNAKIPLLCAVSFIIFGLGFMALRVYANMKDVEVDPALYPWILGAVGMGWFASGMALIGTMGSSLGVYSGKTKLVDKI